MRFPARSGRRRDRPRRGGIDAVLLRELPRESVMHRLGVATKLIALTALSVATGLNTSWLQLAAVGVVVLLAIVTTRVPWRAWPRLPTGYWVLLLFGLVLAVEGYGVGRYVRLTGFTLLFLVLSLVIAWTTRLAEIGPALRWLGAPLRWFGLPVDDWALTAALTIRCLPLIMDEFRTVLAARRQRGPAREAGTVAPTIADVVTTSMAASIRRARDLGEVIALRGGPAPPPPQPQRLHLRDVAALIIISAASVMPSVIG